jgi:FkbM family methyltransferase
VSELAYRAGAAAIRFAQRLGPVATPLDLVARVWHRYARIRSLLSHFAFDGVIDGGANVGEFAHLVRRTLPQADLVCVEPHPRSAAVLRRKGFRVVEAALWKEPGHLTLVQPAAASTSCTVVGLGASTISGAAPSWEVEAIRLDTLPLRGSRILIKLDLQGAEEEALEGAGSLWQRCAALLLEVSTVAGGSYDPLRSLLDSRGYREYSTLNEFESLDGAVMEADKVFVRKGLT